MPGTHVTVVLPRRSYSPLLGRLLHDRTADKIAAAVSRIPRSAATIIPFDVTSRVELLQQRQAAGLAKTLDTPDSADGTGDGQAAGPAQPDKARAARKAKDPHADGGYRRPVPSVGADPIGNLTGPGRAVVEGRVRSLEIRPVEHNSVLACDIADSTGVLTALVLWADAAFPA